MTTSAKTESTSSKAAPKASTSKTAPKAAAPKAEAPKAESPKVEAPAAPSEETKAASAPEEAAKEATSAEPTQEQQEDAANFGEELKSMFAQMFGVPADGLAFAPEGFFLELDEETGCCGGAPEQSAEEVILDEVFSAGIAEGLARANHPAYGFGVPQAPAPVAPSLDPIQVVDETTAAFAHLVDLKKLHTVGILTDAEYEGKKNDILRRIY